MINLIDYFFINIESNAYYKEKFYNLNIELIKKEDEYVFDELEAIDKFKENIYPYADDKIHPENVQKEDNLFILLCFYLNQEGYLIEEFPTLLSRPKNRWDFSNNVIRRKILSDPEHSGSVLWEERRAFIDKLHFKKNPTHIKLEDTLEELMKNVSLNDSKFSDKSDDEKLHLITNTIEFLLKDNENSKYSTINYNDCFEFLSDKEVKQFRDVLQNIRHSNKEAVQNRNKISEIQKKFLINYGITILNYIFLKIKEESAEI